MAVIGGRICESTAERAYDEGKAWSQDAVVFIVIDQRRAAAAKYEALEDKELKRSQYGPRRR
jgi:hypothetical protein